MGIAIFKDAKSNGTYGGSSVVGTQTRDLNTIDVNNIAGLSLSGNQMTFSNAGTFIIKGIAPGYGVGTHRAIIKNITSGIAYPGQNALAGASTSVMTNAEVIAEVTVAAGDVVELQHYTERAVTTSGLGFRCADSGDEIYAIVIIED